MQFQKYQVVADDFDMFLVNMVPNLKISVDDNYETNFREIS